MLPKQLGPEYAAPNACSVEGVELRLKAVLVGVALLLIAVVQVVAPSVTAEPSAATDGSVSVHGEPKPSTGMDGLAWFFGATTVLGTAIGVWGVIEAKRTKRVQRHINRLAEISMQQEATQEALDGKKTELLSASQELAALRAVIESELPNEARRAVLRNRLDTEAAQLVQTHQTILRVRSELSELGDPADLPPEVLAAVRDELRPEALTRARISRLKTWLTAVTSLGAIATGLTPRPLDQIVLAGTAIAAVAILLFLADALLPADRKTRRRYQLAALLCVWGFGALGLLGFGGIILLIAFEDPSTGGLVWFGGSMLFVGGLAGVVAGCIWHRNRRELAGLVRSWRGNRRTRGAVGGSNQDGGASPGESAPKG